MRRGTFVILGVLLMTFSCAKKTSVPGHVQFFTDSFSSALQKADAEGKILMINFYTDW